MILASTAKGSNLLQLAVMANSVMEVILPSITTVATPQTTEIKELKAEVASLRRQLLDIKPQGGAEAIAEATGEPGHDHVLYRSLGFVDITDILEIPPKKCTPYCTKQGNERASS